MYNTGAHFRQNIRHQVHRLNMVHNPSILCLQADIRPYLKVVTRRLTFQISFLTLLLCEADSLQNCEAGD